MGRVRSAGVALLVVVGLVVAACGGGSGGGNTPVVVVVTATPAASVALTAAPTVAAAPAPGAAPTAAAPVAKAGDSIKPTDASKASAQATKPAGTSPSVTSPGSTAVKPGTKVQVDALWYGTGPQGPIGGTSKVAVAVEKQGPNDEVRVGFFESEVGGSGPMWRSAGWMAVISSGLLLGIDPSEYRYTYDVGGRVDGPSAGALMTIATLSTMLGHTVRADSAMTGTINPDGTIGPVGGIPHKIDGAAKAGKKLVLIPAGQRQSMDMATKQSVDVIDRGRRQGVEVREVSDVYEAYEMLTGQPLPKPPGTKDVRPALPGTSFERTRAKAKEWYTRYYQTRAQYQALPQAVRIEITDVLMAEADKAGEKADSFYSQGAPSAAYNRAFGAALYSAMGYHTAKVVESYLANGMDGGIAYLKAMSSVNLKIDGFVDRLETQQAAKLGDVLAISDAYGNVTLALGLVAQAEAALQRQVKTPEEMVAALTEATLYYVIADNMVESAKDSLDVALGFGSAAPPPPAKVERLAELFRRAAEANLNYFESIVINELAEGAGVHPNQIKAAFATNDFTYTFAVSTLQAMAPLKRRAPNGSQAGYATLGGAIQSYSMSSVLVAKYYSLGAQVDSGGNVTGITNERAMINMLDFAEKRARELIGLASSVGAEPVGPVISYEAAKIDREGDAGGKLNALQGFWSAALQAQMVAILSGKASVVK